MSGSPLEPPPSEAPLGAGYTLTFEKPRTGLAVGAMVCGIVGLGTAGICVPAGLLGLILGIIALVSASRDPTRHGGKGMAVAGICTGAVSLLLLAPGVLVAILMPSLSKAREQARAVKCAANLHQVAQAALTYAMEQRDFLPVSLPDLCPKYLPSANVLKCPSPYVAGRACDYYYVPLPAGQKLSRIRSPGTWIVAYEDPANHPQRGPNVLYLDGHVATCPPAKFPQEIEHLKAEYEQVFGLPPTIIAPE